MANRLVDSTVLLLNYNFGLRRNLCEAEMMAIVFTTFFLSEIAWFHSSRAKVRKTTSRILRKFLQ